MHTYVGGNGPSPDGKYTIWGYVHGVSGHAFSDDTKKTIYIDICSTNDEDTNLISHKYHVHGALVGWNAVWDKDDNVQVTFSDYGTNNWAFSHINGVPLRILQTVFYKRDPTTGKFIEVKNN